MSRATNLTTEDARHEAQLQLIADWRIARHQQAIANAKSEKATGFFTRSFDARLWAADNSALAEMRRLERELALIDPASQVVATELLQVATEILAHRECDDQHPLSCGPVLQIVRNVRDCRCW